MNHHFHGQKLGKLPLPLPWLLFLSFVSETSQFVLIWFCQYKQNKTLSITQLPQWWFFAMSSNSGNRVTTTNKSCNGFETSKQGEHYYYYNKRGGKPKQISNTMFQNSWNQ
jgi:hypothetical protein